MSLASRMLVLGTILVAGACDSPVGPRSYSEDEVRVTVKSPNLTLTNESDQRIVYVIMTADLANISLLSLRGWPSIPPGGSVAFKYSEIPGYKAGEEQEVSIQWAAVTGTQDGPNDPASIKGIVVPL